MEYKTNRDGSESLRLTAYERRCCVTAFSVFKFISRNYPGQDVDEEGSYYNAAAQHVERKTWLLTDKKAKPKVQVDQPDTSHYTPDVSRVHHYDPDGNPVMDTYIPTVEECHKADGLLEEPVHIGVPRAIKKRSD